MMKTVGWVVMCVGVCMVTLAQAADKAQMGPTIRVATQATDLILKVDTKGRLCQSYLGKAWEDPAGIEALATGKEAYATYGLEDFYEPAFRMTQADGNNSLQLRYRSHVQKEVNPGVMRTEIWMWDSLYAVDVTLFYEAFQNENIIKTWTQITHRGKHPVQLNQYASAMLRLSAHHYFLTEFTGGWGSETTMAEQELLRGKKVMDTRLGTRAAMLNSPFFILGMDAPASEFAGDVLLGTINWTGNFQFTFEVEGDWALRLLAGINSYASEYELKPGERFHTPEFVFTLSSSGTSAASRSFHDWARKYQLKDGQGERLTLLNNWEATGFGFDEKALKRYIKSAADLGVDLFLLDDGWFGNKHPRGNDTQGLGDWQPTASKLPNGVSALVGTAQEEGVKFGIWIEPEMVNPKSELYEKHPEWVIHYPNREPYYFRHQLVLDLCNPAVQDYVFGVVDKLMSENPGLAYFKWDCNSMLSNPYSYYLQDRQSQLFVDYVRGFYSVLERIKAKYPHLPMMLCSGGGGRCDYEALKYFTEFWPSDNTDPVRRLFIQWGYSHFFPSKTLGAHVTSWGEQSIKFRTDVAMMGKLGFDIDLDKLTPAETDFCRGAVQHYKRLAPVIQEGDLFRLVSPYSGNHVALMYVTPDRTKSVLFAYDTYPNKYVEKLYPVLLKGLDPKRIYSVKEINKLEGAVVRPFLDDGKEYTGEYLMKVGINPFTDFKGSSRVVEICAQ